MDFVLLSFSENLRRIRKMVYACRFELRKIGE